MISYNHVTLTNPIPNPLKLGYVINPVYFLSVDFVVDWSAVVALFCASDLTDRCLCFAWFVGNLYFANVVAEDSRGGVSYLCIVQNMELRSLVQGDDQKIDPQPISGNLTQDCFHL